MPDQPAGRDPGGAGGGGPAAAEGAFTAALMGAVDAFLGGGAAVISCSFFSFEDLLIDDGLLCAGFNGFNKFFPFPEILTGMAVCCTDAGGVAERLLLLLLPRGGEEASPVASAI